MTEETKKRLPSIIERIDELMDEVEKIHREEFEEYRTKRDALDEYGRIMGVKRVKRLHEAYVSLDDSARLLETF